MRPGVRAAAAIFACFVLAVGGYWSIRLSWADWLFRRNTLSSVARAVALDPANGRYHAWLAELLDNEGQSPAAELDAAARLNPLDSRVWIRRGLNAEMNGNPAEGERLLLHAAGIDRLLEPRWTLMNFYFRQGNEDRFWRWAKESLAISYGDRAALFELCWKMRPDGPTIAARALPPSYPILKQFLQFLLAKGQVDQAGVLAEGIVSRAPEEDKAVFLDCLEQVLRGGNPLRAMKIWNGLCERRLLPFAPLDPAKGLSLTNGGFATFPSSVGFDWRMPANAELTAIRTQSPEGLRISLSGKQGDACPLLTQTLPLGPSRRYRLRFWFKTADIRPGAGLVLVAPGVTGPDLQSEDWREQTVDFVSGTEVGNSISFEYRRPLGRTHAEGSLWLRDVRLELAR